MNEYQYIINPVTNRKCRVDTSLGKRIIRNYISQVGGGRTSGVRVSPAGAPSRGVRRVVEEEEKYYAVSILVEDGSSVEVWNEIRKNGIGVDWNVIPDTVFRFGGERVEFGLEYIGDEDWAKSIDEILRNNPIIKKYFIKILGVSKKLL
uniref:Uncharacterized protein n=1 Tax=viral metagenome TaxID=1070528 RepID=A0A6C0JF36_9ZZZZ